MIVPFISRVFINRLNCQGNKVRKMSTFVTNNVIKSREDKRIYRGLMLENQLKVMLISDPKSDKSAASLSVGVGSLSDPDNLPGLAHFCEHMLFLGTEKYPCENEYTKYLAEHGGTSNACTGYDHTDYYFDVVPDHLPGALDRFAQFFICPLFTQSATEREINAVESEHCKNIPQDSWRLLRLESYTCKPGHPYQRFRSGNKMTLELLPAVNDINVRDALLEFHEKWYSANIMTLAVLGKQSLDCLQKLVETLFTAVPCKPNVIRPIWEDHPLGKDELCKRAFVVPIKDFRTLSMHFAFPDLRKYYKCGIEKYISNLLGHEDDVSLLAALKRRGLCNNLCAGYDHAARGFSFFSITVDLTETGLQQYETVVQLIFEYIALLKSVGPVEWIFNETRDILNMEFNYKDVEHTISYVKAVSSTLQEFPLDEALYGPYMATEWNPDLIKANIEMLNIKNCRYAICSKDFEPVADMLEDIYEIEYKLEDIPKDTIEKLSNITTWPEEMKMPAKNEFLPSSFELVPCENKVPTYPIIILDTNTLRVWHKQDDEFLLPKGDMIFEFASPFTSIDPLHYVMMMMYVNLLRDSLTAESYTAELAGIKWNILSNYYGLQMKISGFNDKHHVLLETVLDRMVNYKVDVKRFNIWKEIVTRSLKNWKSDQPYLLANYYFSLLISEFSWTRDQMLEACDFLKMDNFSVFINQFLTNIFVEVLLHGNLNRERAMEFSTIIEKKLPKSSIPLLPPHLLPTRDIQIIDGEDFVFRAECEAHKSSCARIYLQCPMQGIRSNVLLELFVQIAHEPCYNVLRTKEQLGYIINLSLTRGISNQGVQIVAQSESHPVIVDQRIEAFLADMENVLVKMSDQEFHRHKTTLAEHKLEKPKKMSSKSAKFWGEILSQRYNFEQDHLEVAYLRRITKADIIQFYLDYIHMYGKERRKLAVHIVSTSNTEVFEDVLPPPNVSIIEDVIAFKNKQAYYPFVEPYLNIKPRGTRSKL